ncbi:MAG: family 78 glycoside hydrolase catalytic domain, partial [Spirochaetales bacterium]|nr:family 78 glycoside hydrolase catalytic domain [Spirochaetales bacterium]
EMLKPVDDDPVVIASPYLRTDFIVSGKIKRAVIYATAKGLYELSVNGKRVGQDLFAPGWTDYFKRIRYQTYNVTELIENGANTVGAVLGTGWYCGYVAWWTKLYGETPALLAQLEIEYEDGSIQTIGSGEHWSSSTGPILASDMLQGETYDARLEIPGWDSPGFDDSGWPPVNTAPIAAGAPILDGSTGSPIRLIQEIQPLTVTEQSPEIYIFDMGQNMGGTVRLSVAGDTGDQIRLRYAEVLNDDGSIYTENLREAKATDLYILRGNPDGEVWEPKFTYHGFRYVEISGFSSKPELDQLSGLVIHTEMPHTGGFSCSNELLNQLQHNIEWGQRGNYVDVPTDCPQRDERQGWMGDAQVFAATGCYNFETAGFLTKWLLDVRDSQHDDGCFPDFAPEPDTFEHNSKTPLRQWRGAPGWADAGILIPWAAYSRYGDLRLLRDGYPSMKKYMKFIVDESPNLIGPDFGYGDWVNDFAFTPLDLISTAFNAYSSGILSQIAEILGETEDAENYRDLFARIRTAFDNRFVTSDGRITGDTQTAYVLALRFNLLPEEKRRNATNRLVYDIENGRSALWPYEQRKGHVSSGFLGVNLINPTLADEGYLDIAYQLLLNEDYPSWLFQVKHGATTIWERWDGYHPERGFQDPRMNSFNHYAYGAIGQWMYEYVAGIIPLHPGYKKFAIRPMPGGGLSHAEGTYDSIYGRIVSSWFIHEETFILSVTVPVNTEAEVTIPGICTGEADAVLENRMPAAESEDVKDIKLIDGRVVITIGSGSYQFAAPVISD